ncbi:hypothetical protein JVT61DRAFT_15472 [Boletus reticuloceps]|uniref:Uncharacterized protein n=1 Tax=Boletus reticuloceps TaxID=495285 RepID=A0A8I2YCG0_9AGAM|nr:hypothetical protein JVT61DRAFT_15472 [Boletus reticuloceps]
MTNCCITLTSALHRGLRLFSLLESAGSRLSFGVRGDHLTFAKCTECRQVMFYVMTTEIDVDDNQAVHDAVAVNLTFPLGKELQNLTMLAHIAACSISAQTISATLNLQENQPVSTTGRTAPSSSNWSTWSPGNATDFSVGMATALKSIPVDVTDKISVIMPNGLHYAYTRFDAYMMNLLGINATSSVAATTGSRSSANPSVKLTPSQLEDAIAQTTAKLLWLSGQLGESVGGFERTVGESRATRNALQWRLNLNIIPLWLVDEQKIVFASVASFTALILVPLIVGKKSKEHSPLITGTSVLECLWLEAQSEALHSRMKAIEEPRSDSLRAGGMFDVSLGDIGRSSLASEAMG